jgi:hypothetical protein
MGRKTPVGTMTDAEPSEMIDKLISFVALSGTLETVYATIK